MLRLRLKFTTGLALVTTALVLAACTPTSQILPVTPRPQVNADSSRAGGRTIAIEVVDARGTNVVGLRDENLVNSKITAAPEMLRNIQNAVNSGYEKIGFKLLPMGDDADVALEIRLTELGYQRDPNGLLRDLRTGATFEVTSVMPSKTVNAVYRDGQAKDTLVKPSLSENATILNKHIDAALAKLIADPRLTTE